MRKLLFLFIIFTVSTTLNAVTLKVNLTPCFDMSNTKAMGRDMETILRNEFCTQTIAPESYSQMANSALPRLMNKSFLGVEPPPGWQSLSHDILQTCLAKKNLCLQHDREEFSNCLNSMVPLLLIQFGPWLGESCPQLNNEVIKNWQNKKVIFIQIIKDAKASVSSPQSEPSTNLFQIYF